METTDSISIGVSEGTQKIELNPGETYAGSFQVINPSHNRPVKYQISIAPFSVSDETYDISFDDKDDYNQIVEWATVEKTEGELEPNAKEDIYYNIVVPETAPAGGQYLGFLVKIVNEESDKTNFSLSTESQVSVILYASVAGETKKEAEILENNISFLNLDRPLEVSSLVENNGNVHLSANYNLRVYSLFSGEELYSNEDVSMEKTVLPETTFFAKETWEGTPRLGIFRVVQEISVVDAHDKKERIVVACPSWFLFLCLLFLFSMIFWVLLRIRERKNHKVLS